MLGQQCGEGKVTGGSQTSLCQQITQRDPILSRAYLQGILHASMLELFEPI